MVDNIATCVDNIATCVDNIATCVDNYRKLWKTRLNCGKLD